MTRDTGSDRRLLVTVSMEPEEIEVWAHEEELAKDKVAAMIGVAGLRAIATFTVKDYPEP